ncbi:MAG: heme-binding protein [Alphaproteobacteria bacterium]
MVSLGLRPASQPFVRLSGPAHQVADSLGPLANLVGTWMGSKGWEIIAVPAPLGNPPTGETFRLIIRPYIEIITFVPIGAPVPNRGYPDDLFITGVQYDMRICDAETNQPLHLETGMWLYLPGQAQTIARSATVPHGDSLLALGNATTLSGAPAIPKTTAIPVIKGFKPGYTDNYLRLPSTIPFVASDVSKVLQDAIAQQTISQTDQLDISTANGGGVLNIPFVTAQANTNAFTCTYWIETIKTASGDVQQLQYLQQANLNFIKQFDNSGDLIMWPHINMNTLSKQ